MEISTCTALERREPLGPGMFPGSTLLTSTQLYISVKEQAH